MMTANVSFKLNLQQNTLEFVISGPAWETAAKNWENRVPEAVLSLRQRLQGAGELKGIEWDGQMLVGEVLMLTKSPQEMIDQYFEAKESGWNAEHGMVVIHEGWSSIGFELELRLPLDEKDLTAMGHVHDPNLS